MIVLEIILGIGIVASLAILIGGILYWRKGKDAEDEEQIMYGKRAILLSLLAFLVCTGVLIALFMMKQGIQPVSPVVNPITTGKPSLGFGMGGEDGVSFDPPLQPTLSTGVLDYHYPVRAQKQVPLNTLIVVHKASEGAELSDRDITMHTKSGTEPVTLDQVSTSGDTSTMVFKPHELLKPGTIYSVSVKGYVWDFTTDTSTDTTVPEVISTSPGSPAGGQPDAKDPLPRNSMVEFTFSEPVLMVASDAISVGAVNMPPVQAQVRQAPPYKAIDVLGKEVCGLNACKKQIYCFGTGTTLRIALKEQAIMDFAGNYLSQGGIHTVAIGDTVSMGSAQSVIRTVPLDLAIGVDTKAPLEVWFSSVVAKSTLGPKAVTLNYPEVNTWLSSFDTVDTATTTADARSLQQRATKVFVWHDPFNTKTIYYATVAPGVQDLLQNCVAPY